MSELYLSGQGVCADPELQSIIDLVNKVVSMRITITAKSRKRSPDLARSAAITVTIILCAIISISCQRTSESPNQLTSPLASIATSPLFPQENAPTVKTPIPTSQPGLGTVIGRALHLTGQPYQGTELFLATVLPSENESDTVLYGLDVNSAPKAYRQASGEFVFINVPPGTYVLVAWSPVASFVITLKTGEVVEVTVEANEIHNLGELFISP